MFCKHCGNEISNDSKFCPYCGKASIEPIIQSTAIQNTETQFTQKPKNSKKSKIFLGVIIAIVLIIIFSAIAKMGIDKHKEEERIKKISSVQLNGFAVSREQYDVIDPNYILRYILNGQATANDLTSYGFSKAKYGSDDRQTKFEQKSISDFVEKIEVVSANDQSILKIMYSYTPKYTHQSFMQLTSTLESITNTSLKWYNDGNFYDSSSLALGNGYANLGKEYVCVIDVEPRFIHLEISQDGGLEVTYSFSENQYFKTYQDFTENATPADYDAIQKNECDCQQVYIQGTVLGIMETNLLDIAMILTDSGVYRVFYYQGDFVCSFEKDDTVNIYGDVIPDSLLVFYDRKMIGFDMPFEAIQADVIERVEN